MQDHKKANADEVAEPPQENTPDNLYKWKPKDAVDVQDSSTGAWFEASIQQIDLNANGSPRYNITFDHRPGTTVLVELPKVRPRARKKIFLAGLRKGMLVLANYNFDNPDRRGYWYDFVVTKKMFLPLGRSSSNRVYGRLLSSNAVNGAQEGEEYCLKFVKEIFRIDDFSTSIKRDYAPLPERRKVKANCIACDDDLSMECSDCGCCVCGNRKGDEDAFVTCDGCQLLFHVECVPDPIAGSCEDWLCPSCTNNGLHTTPTLNHQKKDTVTIPKGPRHWDSGMACAGRTKTCTIVPSNHFGPIPGVAVGSSWKFRLQASECGVHRPHVSGIAGRSHEGAYSLVLAGGYEDDVDDGDDFMYTGSGGRDLSGNKRTEEQSFDQVLTRSNLALARNCDSEVDEIKGGEARKWQDGRPIRVLRSYKLAKHSEYAPTEGCRYDGIYKVVKYWPDIGQSGFFVWRYQLRRDDPVPAPWTEEGKCNIVRLGLKIEYPEGYVPTQVKKRERRVTIEDNTQFQQKEDGGDKLERKRSKRKRNERVSEAFVNGEYLDTQAVERKFPKKLKGL